MLLVALVRRRVVRLSLVIRRLPKVLWVLRTILFGGRLRRVFVLGIRRLPLTWRLIWLFRLSLCWLVKVRLYLSLWLRFLAICLSLARTPLIVQLKLLLMRYRRVSYCRLSLLAPSSMVRLARRRRLFVRVRRFLLRGTRLCVLLLAWVSNIPPKTVVC